MKKQIFAAAIIFVLLWSVPASAREITVLLKQRVTQGSIGGQGVVLTDARGMYTKPFNGTALQRHLQDILRERRYEGREGHI